MKHNNKKEDFIFLQKGFKINWDDLNLENSYDGLSSYRHSKLANCLFTIELDKRLKDTGVIAVALHPGNK